MISTTANAAEDNAAADPPGGEMRRAGGLCLL
jgi:hypothetical protein